MQRLPILRFAQSALVIYLILVLFTKCHKSDPPNLSGKDPTAAGDSCSATWAAADSIEIFPADNAWNEDISGHPVDSFSNQIIAGFSASGLKADFGSGLWQGAPIGIPFMVVCANQKPVPIVFRANSYDGNYGDESDPGPYPIPLTAPIEGNGQGDSHVIAVDKDHDRLYELYNASVAADHWEASAGAVFNLASDQFRPAGWTSADAAGLPIFPGLVRFDEVNSGTIRHAIRFTLQNSLVAPYYISPARHSVNSTGGTYGLPFGARLRLKQAYDVSGFPQRVQVILNAMKKYGIILADIGSNLYISGAPDARWNNDELQELGQVKATDLQVVSFGR
jgi:hypothetical protein